MDNEEDLFEKVRLVREILKNNKNVVFTEKYRKVAEKVKNGRDEYNLSWFAIPASRSAYLRKAALKAAAVDFLRDRLREYDSLSRAGDREGSEKAILRASKTMEVADKYGFFDSGRPGQGRGRWSEYWSEHAAERPAALRAARKKGRCVSKRRGLGKLPADWRESLSQAMGYPVVLDILSLSGCRPAEIPKLSVAMEDGSLVILISGAKVKNSGHHCGAATGQAVRTLRIPIASPAAGRLASLLDTSGTISIPDRRTLRNLRESIARASQKLFSQRLSYYSFRHQLASDMKRSGMEVAEIAAFLGHASTKTQSVYGRAGSGRSPGGAMPRATASSPVRTPRRSPPSLEGPMAPSSSGPG